MIPGASLYEGTVRHRRFTPRAHAFTYSLFMAFLDIDRIPETMRASRLTGCNRFRLASYDDRDHFGNPADSLRQRVAASAAAASVELPDGPIFLLTHLRYAGYVFNPISLFYCYDSGGVVRAVLAEVNNTYGGRHLYWLRADRTTASGTAFHSTVDKMLYVSPFMQIDSTYQFVLTPPGDTLVAHMNVDREAADDGCAGAPRRVLDATLTLSRRDWSSASIRSALVRFPLMTAKVIGSIHWEALKLYLKGVPVIPRRVPNGMGERSQMAEGRQ